VKTSEHFVKVNKVYRIAIFHQFYLN